MKQPYSLSVRLFRKPSQFNLCLCLPREFIDGLHQAVSHWLHKQKLYSYLCSWQLASHCTPITWIGLTSSELSTRRQSCLMIFSFHTLLLCSASNNCLLFCERISARQYSSMLPGKYVKNLPDYPFNFLWLYLRQHTHAACSHIWDLCCVSILGEARSQKVYSILAYIATSNFSGHAKWHCSTLGPLRSQLHHFEVPNREPSRAAFKYLKPTSF